MKFIKLLIASAFILPTLSHAWEPTKTVNVTVGFGPGSGNEVSFRGVSSIIERSNPKIKFNIENRPGADGVVAMNEFISKPSDGHSVYIPSHQGIWVTADVFQKDVKKFTLDDFEYTVSIAKSPLAIIAPANSPVNTVPELLDLIKNTKKPVTFAAGSGAHKLAFVYMMNKTGANQDLVKTANYKGPLQAGQDVAGGFVEFGIIPTAIANTLVQTGKVKFIALCSEQKLRKLPNVPLMHDYVPGMNVYAGWGIILPKGTPKVIVEWYTTEFAKAIRSPEAQKFFDDNMMFSQEKLLTPAGFKRDMLDLRTQWLPIVQNMKLD